MKARPPHCGFSLIEAALVLGIVALVVGGIWVAASAVMTQKRARDADTIAFQLWTEAQKNIRSMTKPIMGNMISIGALLRNEIAGMTCNDPPNCWEFVGNGMTMATTMMEGPTATFSMGFFFTSDGSSTYTPQPVTCMALVKRIDHIVRNNRFSAFTFTLTSSPTSLYADEISELPDITATAGYCKDTTEIGLSVDF